MSIQQKCRSVFRITERHFQNRFQNGSKFMETADRCDHFGASVAYTRSLMVTILKGWMGRSISPPLTRPRSVVRKAVTTPPGAVSTHNHRQVLHRYVGRKLFMPWRDHALPLSQRQRCYMRIVVADNGSGCMNCEITACSCKKQCQREHVSSSGLNHSSSLMVTISKGWIGRSISPPLMGISARLFSIRSQYQADLTGRVVVRVTEPRVLWTS